MRYQSVPHKIGTSLRPQHYDYLEQHPSTKVAWFEAASEACMSSRGRPFETVQLLRQDYPIALHGSAMNIANPQGVCPVYLQKLADLADVTEPFLISDHICWTGQKDESFHDLLPLPYTQDALEVIAANIDHVQNVLKRSLVLENIASYVTFRNSEMSEWEFLAELCKRSGARLLLDLSSLYVNTANHNWNLKEYLDSIPKELIVQVHLSGPSDHGTFMLNSKSTTPPEDLWNLLRYLSPHIHHLPIAIERDENIPDFSELEVEVEKAAHILEKSHDDKRSTEYI